MRIVALSDTHGHHESPIIPDGDVFVFAGDFTKFHNSTKEPAKFGEWVASLPHRHKIVVAGNHDWCMARNSYEFPPGVIYLESEGAVIEGVSFWGSPWTPYFYDWAFNFDPKPQIYERQAFVHFQRMSDPLDVLVTHGPPHGILDSVRCPYTEEEEIVGCQYLAARVQEVEPQVHIFGHIHKHGGRSEFRDGTTFYNVSVCGEDYKPERDALVIDVYART